MMFPAKCKATVHCEIQLLSGENNEKMSIFIHDILQSAIVISKTIAAFLKKGLINTYSWYHCANDLHGYTLIPATFQTSPSDPLLPLNMCFSLTNLRPTEVALSLVLL